MVENGKKRKLQIIEKGCSCCKPPAVLVADTSSVVGLQDNLRSEVQL